MMDIYKSQKEPIAIVLNELINLLNCKITYSSIKESVLRHPAFPSLFCITNTLANFGLNNKVVRIKPEQLPQLETPFLATTYIDETLLVRNFTDDKVDYFSPSQGWQEKSLSHFVNQWSQMVILVDTGTHIEENAYVTKKKRGKLHKIRLPIALSVLAFLITVTAFHLSTELILPYFICKIFGLLVSLLLVNKEINNNVNYSFCDVGSKISCDEVLNSPAAKIFSWLSMTDLGLLYFTSTLSVVTFSTIVPAVVATSLLKLSIFLGFLAIPYTLFSIVYQGLNIKKMVSAMCSDDCSTVGRNFNRLSLLVDNRL